LLVVASQLSKAGVELVGVAEPVPMWTGLTILPALAREWPLLADGMRYRAALKRNGVPWFSRTILTRIEGTDAVTAAVISSVDCEWRPIGGSEQRFEVDAVAMGYGLLPSIELPRLCGCAVQYDALARTWRPVRSAQFESSVPGIFLVGDGAGVAGVIVAIEEGRVAGLAIATQLGKLPASEAMQKSAPHMKRLAALGRGARSRVRAATRRVRARTRGDDGLSVRRGDLR
jgi:hypothetical protein